jgi:hypothetical protein
MIFTPREIALQEFINAAADAPLVWGVSDCSSWAARWVETITGRAPVLPTYRSREEAHALIAAAGGLAPLWDDALSAIGIFTTTEIELGDVGIIETRLHGPVGLVFAHAGIGYWRAEQGAACLAPRKVLRAWRVI